MKNKTYKEKETEKQRGKKRYLERIVEEQEADKEIEQYEKEEKPTFPERDE